jgi:hypothetical protein
MFASTPKLRHYAADDEAADETIIECLLRAAPKSILIKDKKGRTPLDRAREAEVGMAAYNVLRAYFKAQKEQEKGGGGSATKSPKGGVSSKVKKKKIKQEDLDGSAASIDLQVKPVEELSDSSANFDQSAKRSTKKKIKKKKEKDLDMSTESVDLIDVDGERDSDFSGDLGASMRRLKKNTRKTKKKHNADPIEPSAPTLLDHEGGYRSMLCSSQASLNVLVTPKKKKSGSQDIPVFDDSMTVHANGKSKKASTRSSSVSRRRSSVKIENEEGIAHSNDSTGALTSALETPKPSKNKVDSVLRTPGSVSSKAKTPTSSVVTRRRRLKKDMSRRSSRSDGIDEGVASTLAPVPISYESRTRSKSPRSMKSSAKSSIRSKSSTRRVSASGRMGERASLAIESPVLPDLMTPSAPKTCSAMVSDFLATPQLGGESMNFLPPVWGDGETDLQ